MSYAVSTEPCDTVHSGAVAETEVAINVAESVLDSTNIDLD